MESLLLECSKEFLPGQEEIALLEQQLVISSVLLRMPMLSIMDDLLVLLPITLMGSKLMEELLIL